jgi:hypothetical protein
MCYQQVNDLYKRDSETQRLELRVDSLLRGRSTLNQYPTFAVYSNNNTTIRLGIVVYDVHLITER